MLPKVVIVGRPNVGKSSLLNLLSGRLISIVDPTPGVTRDRVSTTVDLDGRAFELIDTGGYGLHDSQHLEADVEHQIGVGLDDADLILFVIDAQSGVVTLDERVAQILRTRSGAHPKPVILVANKVDSEKHEAGAAEASSLGFGEPVAVSAVSSYNKRELLEAIIARLPEQSATPEPLTPAPHVPLLAIVGKRNAGKSTLVNALAGQDRMIVSELEGTTRDAVDVRFEQGGKSFIAIDTAGVRKTKSLQGDIEFYSQHRALRSVRRADVVFLLIDAAVPVSQVDKQLSNEVQEHFKPCVVVVNKWDLAQADATQEQYMEYLDKELMGLNYAPVAFISAKAGDGMRELVAEAMDLHRQAGIRVPTAKLNEAVEKIMAAKPPTSGIGRRPRIYYVTQTDAHPPTIALFVNDPAMFTPSYQRFLINRFRETLPFPEVPIKLVIRGKERETPGEADKRAKPRRETKGRSGGATRSTQKPHRRPGGGRRGRRR